MDNCITKLFLVVWSQISGDLRDAIVKSVKEWEQTAAETPSMADDIMVAVVKVLFGIT